MRPALCLLAAAALAMTAAPAAEAFAPLPASLARHAAAASSTPTVALEACRTNAKKEKRERNRENMRKYKKNVGKKATSAGKTRRAEQSKVRRATLSEFVAKLFITTAPSEEEGAEAAAAPVGAR